MTSDCESQFQVCVHYQVSLQNTEKGQIISLKSTVVGLNHKTLLFKHSKIEVFRMSSTLKP